MLVALLYTLARILDMVQRERNVLLAEPTGTGILFLLVLLYWRESANNFVGGSVDESVRHLPSFPGPCPGNTAQLCVHSTVTRLLCTHTHTRIRAIRFRSGVLINLWHTCRSGAGQWPAIQLNPRRMCLRSFARALFFVSNDFNHQKNRRTRENKK